VYGTHPFGIFLDKGTKYFSGLFYRTSNAFDLSVSQSKKKTVINIFSTSSYIEMFFFFPTLLVDNIIEDYHNLIGTPYLPPFWSLGFHACNWGWKSTTDLYDAIKGYEEHNMPVDTMWIDIDYM